MKLRLRSHETRETLKLELADTFNLHDLRRRINASSPSSVHLSLNRKDEIISSSPEDTLRSLGITSGDLLYYSLDPSAFVGCPPELEFASSVEGQRTLVLDGQDSGEKLGGEETTVQEFHRSQATDSSSTGTRSWELDVSMNIGNQASTDPNFDAEEQIEGHMQAISGKEEAQPMDVEYGNAVFASRKRLSEPFFLKKVLMEESGDTGVLTFLTMAVHAVMLESGFCRFNPGSGVQGEKFRFSVELPPIFLRYTLPDLITRGDPNMNDSVSVKFQNLGHVIIVYGKLGERSPVYRVSLEKRRFVPAIDLVMNMNSDKEGSSSVYREVFEFWKIVKDGLAMPLLIGLCDKTGLELPPCLMRLPAELKLKILESLPGVDIARMACVCSEMRYVASNDDLWKQKCLEVIPSSVAEAKNVFNWKVEFATYWLTQKRQNRALPLARRMRPPPNPFPVIRRDRFPPGFPPLTWYDGDRQPPALPFHFRRRSQGQGFGQLRRMNFSPSCNLGGLN